MSKPSKVFWIIAAGMPIALVIFVILGPRPEMSETLAALQLPPDLEFHIRQSEATFADIRPGTEKIIIWAEPGRKKKTPVSVVYLHGFSASRQETAPLSEKVAEQLGANLFYTRLRGHGRTGKALGEVVVSDWLTDAQEAFEIGKRLGDRVVLIGSSTGATLCVWMLHQRRWQPQVLGAVLISPNFGPRDARSRLLLWPWGVRIARIAVGPTRYFEPVNELQAAFWTTRYPIEALAPMMALVQLVSGKDLSQINTPVLVLYSTADQVVNSRKTETAFERFGSSRKKLLEITGTGDPSHHVLAGDILSPSTTEQVAEEILRFIHSPAG